MSSGAIAQSAAPDPSWIEVGSEIVSPGERRAESSPAGVSFILPTSGSEVIVGMGVTPDDPADSDFPDQIILSFRDGLGAVAIINGIDLPDNILSAYIDGFAGEAGPVTEVMRDSDRWFASGLYRWESASGTMYIFLTVDAQNRAGIHQIEVVIADADSMESSINLLRDNVWIDGVPAFSSVDEADIQRLVDSDNLK